MTSAERINRQRHQDSEWVLVREHGDSLIPGWRDMLAGVGRDVDVVTCDVEVVNRRGAHIRRERYPAWSPVRAAFDMNAHNVFAIRRTALASLDDRGAVTSEPAGIDVVARHRLALSIVRSSLTVEHIPYPLVSRIDSFSHGDHEETLRAGARASEEHLAKLGVTASIRIGDLPGLLTADFTPRAEPVTVVIPTGFARSETGDTHLAGALESLARHLGGVDGDEVIVVASRGEGAELMPEAVPESRLPVRLVEDTEPFNFSQRVNLGIDAGVNDLVLLMNDDVVVTNDSCISQMTGVLSFPNVGMVGAMLLYEDGTVQHGGLFVDGQNVGIAFSGRNPDHITERDLGVDREVVAVTAALALLRRSVWREVGGLSMLFPLNFNDVDLCFKVRALGYDIIQVNSARAIHKENKTRNPRVLPAESELLFSRWRDVMQRDPYTFNPL